MTTADSPPRSPARAIADLVDGVILATVDIEVPPDRVFKALTTEEITRWWGSDELYWSTKFQADLRVGGRWRSEGVGSDGVPFSVQGEYLEIDPPRRLVQTWVPDWDTGAPTTLAYRLDPIPGGTRVTVRHDGFKGRPESCADHSQGWERVLSWLERFLATPGAAKAGPASDQARGDAFFLCRLIGPRPTFPADMNPAEGEAMQRHVAYWTGLLERRIAIVFGPVADPQGVWGLGVIAVRDLAAAERLRAEDPTLTSGLGFRMELVPMLQAVARR